MNLLSLSMRSFLVAVAACTMSVATAATYNFSCITNNAALSCAIGEAQLSVQVSDFGGGKVLFDFMNAGPAASSITDIYFDDSDIQHIGVPLSILNYAGVSFSQGAVPPNLPGGNTLSPAFVTTTGLSADSDSPIASNGVNPGEHVGVSVTLQNAFTFNDVIAAIDSGALRIGIHVQAFANGKSEGFVAPPVEPPGPPNVPEPGSLSALALGLLGVGYSVYRRRAG